MTPPLPRMGVLMRKSLTVVLALLVIFVSADVSAQSSLYKQKKYFGAIPMNGINLFVGFLDGPDHQYLTEHLGNFAVLRGGSETWDDWSTSLYTRAGYQRQVSPNHFLVTNLNFAYLSAKGSGELFTVSEPPVYVTTERTLSTYLFSLDLGFLYYMIKPEVQKIAPYIGGGFSAVVPHEKLDSTFRRDDGTVVDNPNESLSETSFEPGVYAQFGINYYISNKWGATLDGRFQMTQSKFKIHKGNFDVSYAGLCLGIGLQYYF
jgi:outer membrane protein W